MSTYGFRTVEGSRDTRPPPCGGPGDNVALGLRPTKDKDHQMNTSTYTVTGMTCGHCVGAVTKELSGVPGVTEVVIELVPDGLSMVAVSSGGPLAEDAVRAAIDEAGYELAGTAR